MTHTELTERLSLIAHDLAQMEMQAEIPTREPVNRHVLAGWMSALRVALEDVIERLPTLDASRP